MNASDQHADAPERPKPNEVYKRISAEGAAEIERPNGSIVWSALAAGLAISFSVVGEAALRAHLPDAPWRPLVDNLGYVLGFLIVVQARLQLFTENTITAVFPTLKDPCRKTLLGTARLWSVSLTFNVIGASIAALVMLKAGLLPGEILDAALGLGAHVAGIDAYDSFAKGIPAGFLIAALVWMLPSSEGSEPFVTVLMIYALALGDFTHVVVGTVELMLVVLDGAYGFFPALLTNWLPTLCGNIVGGTLLFALLAWAQVKDELGTDEGKTPETS